MKNTAKSASQGPEDLLHELRALIAEAEKIVNQENGGEATGDEGGREGLRARYEAARDRLTDAGEKLGRKVRTGARDDDDAIRGNPYQAMAIAAGVGVLLGMLLNRRHD